MNERPIRTAVIVSLALVFMLLAVLVSVAGSYVLTLHVLSDQNATASALRAREAVAQLRTAAPVCQAFRALDNAGLKPGLLAHQDHYVRNLGAAIHSFYLSSKCPVLLNGLATHEPLPQILRQMQGH